MRMIQLAIWKGMSNCANNRSQGLRPKEVGRLYMRMKPENERLMMMQKINGLSVRESGSQQL